MITNKTHNKIVRELTLQIAIKDQKVFDYREEVDRLKQELREAKDLKTILDKFSSLTSTKGMVFANSNGIWSTELVLPDNVLVYVDDILGGKVIKQEGTKCLVIDKEGNVETGLTKRKADTGYAYKLERTKS